MAGQPYRGPVVVDTDVYSARLIPNSTLARRYEPVLIGRSEFVSFQTVAEVRYGAMLRGWAPSGSHAWKPRSPGSRSSTPAPN